MLADLVHEVRPPDGDLVDAVVVVAVRREVALDLVIDGQAGFVADDRTLAYLMADSESATTDRPAMPQAMVRRMSRSCRAISMRS
jgi:hypothetical protein